MWTPHSFPYRTDFSSFPPLFISPFAAALFPKNPLLQLPKNLENKTFLPTASTSTLKQLEDVQKADDKAKQDASSISKSQMFLVERLLASAAAASEAEKPKPSPVTPTPAPISPFPVILIHSL